MSDKTVKSAFTTVLHRDMPVNRAHINEENRTVELAFSSELPVERYFGIEILDHNPGSVNLRRLKGNAPLLVNHDPDQHVGVVESARIDSDKVGRAVVRFGKSQRAQEIFDDVKSGIRSLVSVGYRIHKMVTDKVDKGVETLRAIDWEPLELTLASVPADSTVGVGRSADAEEKTIMILDRKLQSPDPDTGGGQSATPPKSTPSVDIRAVEDNVRKAERERVREIDAIGQRLGKINPNVRAMAAKAIQDGTDLTDFRAQALEAMGEAKAITTVDPSIGMNPKEVRQYSLVRAVRQLANEHRLDGLEAEASRAVAKRVGRDPQGFFIPHDVASRALEVGTFSGAGAFVEEGAQGQSMIELLRNKMKVVEMGARTLSGLVGDLAIPRQTGGATAYWLAESAAVTRSDQTVGQLALKPHRLSAATAFSKQLLAQSSQDIESFVRSDIAQVLAIAKDLACLNGSGVSGQPLGIINTTGLSTACTFTVADTATHKFAPIVDAETNVATNNADMGALGYLVTPAVRAIYKRVETIASVAGPVWVNNMMNGYKADVTTQLPSGAGSIIFGNWNDLIIADWDGMDVVVDPYSLSLNGQVSIVVQLMTDCGIRHATSFCINAA